MDSNYQAPAELRRYQAIALAVGVLGMVALVAGGFASGREQAFRSYLIGYVFWIGVSVGSLGLLLLQYVTGGFWGVAGRRILEASTRVLLPMAVLFIPIVLGIKDIFIWAHPEVVEKNQVLKDKVAYLNVNFFILRAVIFFAIWGFLAFMLNRWSRRQDQQGDHGLALWMSRFSGPGLVVYCLVVSFAVFDWVMSLDPFWYSTIFGLIFIANWALTCLAFTIAVMSWLSRRPPMDEFYGPPHFHDLGKLMLAVVMLWAYFTFSQFLLIWSANLPEETRWYITRMMNGWGWVGLIVVILHFALPFLLLLNRNLKKNSRTLVMVAVWLLIMRVVDLYWLMAPARDLFNGEKAISHFRLSWMDVAAPIALGGLWLAYFFWQLAARPLLPVNDPHFAQAVAHGKKGYHEHLIDFSEG
jgi:hypothetical protein